MGFPKGASIPFAVEIGGGVKSPPAKWFRLMIKNIRLSKNPIRRRGRTIDTVVTEISGFS